MTDSATSACQQPRFGFIDDVLLRFLGSAAWNAASVGFSRALNVLSMLLAVNILGPQHFAELGLIQNTLAMLGVFAGLGLGMTATHRISQTRLSAPDEAGRDIARIQGIALTGGLLAAALTVLLGPFTASRILSSDELGPLLQMAAPLLICNVFLGVQQGIFAGLEKLRPAALVQAVGGMVLLGSMYLGAKWDGVRGCVCAQVLALTVQVIISQIVLRTVARESSIRIGFPRFTLSFQGFSSFGLPAALSSMMVMPVEWLVSVMLVNRPGGYEEMGLYAASWQWVSPLLLIPTVIGQTILPIFGERHAAGDRRAPLKLLMTAIAANCAVILPLATAALLWSSTLLEISGPAYETARPTLQLLILGASLYALEVPAGLFLAGQGWIWPAFFSNVGWAVCLLASAAWFVSAGAPGVAAARLFSYACHGIWLSILVWRCHRSLTHHACVSR